MEKTIIVFSGMPASGKDTVSERLHQLDNRYVYLKKYRAIGLEDKPKDSYHNITIEEFEKKINAGDFLQYHGRYERYYGIHKTTLLEMLEANLIPIIHIGRIENYYTLVNNMSEFEESNGLEVRIIHIQLWETKENLKKRIIVRDKTDEEIAKRISAMEQEFDDATEMMKKSEKPFTVVIKNENVETTCNLILNIVKNDTKFDDGYKAFWDYLKNN